MKTIGKKGMPLEVLLIEDNPGDVRLTRETLCSGKRSIHLHVATDGGEAMVFRLGGSTVFDHTSRKWTRTCPAGHLRFSVGGGASGAASGILAVSGGATAASG